MSEQSAVSGKPNIFGLFPAIIATFGFLMISPVQAATTATIPVDAGALTGPDFPRLMGMNIGAKNYDDPAYQQQMSRLDMVILGFYPGWKSSYSFGGYTGIRAAVKALKTKNPRLLVGQYTILNESPSSSNTSNAANADKARKLDQMNWWLHTAAGSQTSWTNAFSAYDINFTSHTRADNQGKRWPQWLAERDYAKFFKPVPEFDIQYFDNVFERNRIRSADWNLDRRDEWNSNSAMISAHRQGHVAEWNRVRQLRSSLKLIGNTDHDVSMPEYRNKLNGGFLEGQMGKSWSIYTWGGWDKMMARYHGAMANTIAPKLVGFDIQGSPTDYRLMRFGLASTLMNDGYFSFTDLSKGYSSVPWFDEYNVPLGRPLEGIQTKPWQNGVYRRVFEKGVALVNPTAAAVTVNVGDKYRHFLGKQAPTVNNGRWVTTVTLQPKDGVLLVIRDLYK
ncbi:putative glycoside hydrolase [Thermithiobacillus plumbiphilus]|uniref:Glycoside hydrolase n=1 Tax=Thermithiobacillus plumbiphilus TaxID=1729899 RepID=A0ABU9D7E6_9PROT